MLQIASGMYFRAVPLHETVHRATLYTNAHRLEPDAVELPIARLLFSTSLAHVSSMTVEVVDRLESERPDGQPEFMVATSGRELVADVATVLAFALNVTCSTDVDLVRRLVPEQLDRRPAAGAPSNILRRTFDPNVVLKATDFVDVQDFCTRLLALRRSKFVAAMRAMRRVIDATVLIADDASLAYTLYVAALESLAQDAPTHSSTWESFDAHKRKLIDTACKGLTDEQTTRVRTAVLEIEQLSLRRKFQAFTLDHVDPSYYRAEAVSASQPISAPALPHALNSAYDVRSRNVHVLKQLEPEMWVMSDRAETTELKGETQLRLEGLNRLCRHVIRQFVYRAPTDLDTGFDYRTALPGIVRVPIASEYWLWDADGLSTKTAPAYLNGFIELLMPVLRGDDGASLVDLTGVLKRIERILRGEAQQEKRLPLVAIYALWHRLLPSEHHRPQQQAVLARFGADLLPPSTAAFAVAVLTDDDLPWSTEELSALATDRAIESGRGRGRPLPARLNCALELCLAQRLWSDGRTDTMAHAVSRAVEAIPGDVLLIDYEARTARGESPEINLLEFVLERGPWTPGVPDAAAPS